MVLDSYMCARETEILTALSCFNEFSFIFFVKNIQFSLLLSIFVSTSIVFTFSNHGNGASSALHAAMFDLLVPIASLTSIHTFKCRTVYFRSCNIHSSTLKPRLKVRS